MSTAIEVSGLGFTHRGATAPTLHDLGFDVRIGEIFGLLGPSGAGKSTTQRILTGQLSGYDGSVAVLGKQLTDWRRDYYEHIGVGFESPVCFGSLTLVENLNCFARLHQAPTRDPMELLECVGLADDARLPAARMSKGMGVRLNVARALIHDPQLLFLDEPTSGLDPVGVARMAQLIRSERDRGHTVVIATHDMSLAERICDRVAFIVEGRLALIGVPSELRRQHGTNCVELNWPGGQAVFPMTGLADNRDFQDTLRNHPVRSIHSQEANLADVFTRLTGVVPS